MKSHKDSHEGQNPNQRESRLFKGLRASFLTGTIVLAPLALTFWVMFWLIRLVDRLVVPLIPEPYQPENLLGVDIAGVGVIIFLLVATLTGWITKGLFGREVRHLIRWVMNRFPIVRSIYNAIEQILETILNANSQNFKKACILEYPRKGLFAVGFITQYENGEISQKLGGPHVAVFLPTAPNPTSGFLLYVPAQEIIVLDMSVEDAVKLVISAGIANPNQDLITNAMDQNV